MSSPNQGNKKVSVSIVLIAACVLGVGIGLFGLNYWQTTKCGSSDHHSHEEVEDFVEALSKRLLHSESQAIKNEILINKIINSMQSNLLKLEDKLYNEIQQESKDEAVKVALFLASHPAPPMPDFPLDKAYNDNEKLADAIDDIFGKEKEEVQDFMNDNYEEKSSSKKETITDSEAIKICNEWKVTYKVSIGVSWGELPYNLQQKWLEYSCDYHMSDSAEALTEVKKSKTSGPSKYPSSSPSSLAPTSN